MTDPYIAASTQEMTITISAPVYDETKELFGVIGNDFSVDVLSKMINEVDIGGFGYAYLVSKTGKILVHSKAELLGKPLSDLVSGPLPPIGPAFTEVTEEGRSTLMDLRPRAQPAARDGMVRRLVDRSGQGVRPRPAPQVRDDRRNALGPGHHGPRRQPAPVTHGRPSAGKSREGSGAHVRRSHRHRDRGRRPERRDRRGRESGGGHKDDGRPEAADVADRDRIAKEALFGSARAR